jgi:hypothetical protein
MTAQDSSDVNGGTGDPVHHPKHYNTHPSGIECVEFSELLPGNLSHACVYVWRHAHKGSPIEDLEKALWFLEREQARDDLESEEARLFLDAPAPAARIAERLRGLRPYIRQDDFVATVVNYLLHYSLDDAQWCIQEMLSTLKKDSP